MDMKEAIAKAFTGNASLRAVTAKLLKVVKADPALIDQALADWAYDICRAHTRDARDLIWDQNKEGHAAAQARVGALERAATETLMNFPLWGGKRLRYATRQEIVESARRFSLQAEDMAWKARWLGLVARKLPDDEITVEEQLTEDHLVKLKEK